MAGDIKWIKVITDIFEDEKVKLIKSMPEGRTLVLIWFQLLVQAGKTNAAGWIYLSEGCAYSPSMLSTLFNESQQMVELALKLFSTKPFEMIEITESGLIYIPNWEKHQNVESMDKIREKERLRKARQRDKQKALMSRDSHGTSHGTSHQSHATEVDKELEEELISTTTTETVVDAYRKVFNLMHMNGIMSEYVTSLMNRGFTEVFIIEVMYEMGESSQKPSLNYFKTIAERWIKESIYTRVEARKRKESERPNLRLAPDQTPKRNKHQLSADREIAFNNWVNEGNSPNDFVFEPIA